MLHEALADIVYIRERYDFTLVCTSRKAIKFFEVKVDIQKGVEMFKEFFLTIVMLVSSNCCHIHGHGS